MIWAPARAHGRAQVSDDRGEAPCVRSILWEGGGAPAWSQTGLAFCLISSQSESS
jgi:hypothetical protein